MDRIRNKSDFREWLSTLHSKSTLAEEDFNPLYWLETRHVLQAYRRELLAALRDCIPRCDHRLTQLRIASIAHWFPPVEEPFASEVFLQCLDDESSKIR